jgi:uncharacterized membrane protein
VNAAHLHLVLNHVPVLGVLFACALVAAAAWRRSEELRAAAWITLAVAAAFAVAAYLSGESAEEVVERLPGVAEEAIEAHEESAEAALVATVVAGGLGLAFAALRRRVPAVGRWAWRGTALAAAAAAALLVRTAYLGGFIRHSEIRDGAAEAVEAGGARDPDEGLPLLTGSVRGL